MSVPLNSGNGEKTLSLCLFLFQAKEFEKTRKTPKRTWWKCFKIVMTTLTILLSVIVILLSTHVIPTWPSLQGLINGSMESEPWIGNSELTWWRTGGWTLAWPLARGVFPLSLFCLYLYLPSTALLLWHFLLGLPHLEDWVMLVPLPPSTQEAKVGRSKSRPPIYTKSLLKTAWWLKLVIPILRKQDCCEFKATPRYTVCSRSNWSYSELFQKVSIFKKHKHCKLYYKSSAQLCHASPVSQGQVTPCPVPHLGADTKYTEVII